MYNYELNDNALKTWVRLRQASEAVEKVLEKDRDRQGSTLAQLDMLATVDASGKPLTPGHLELPVPRAAQRVCTVEPHVERRAGEEDQAEGRPEGGQDLHDRQGQGAACSNQAGRHRPGPEPTGIGTVRARAGAV